MSRAVPLAALAAVAVVAAVAVILATGGSTKTPRPAGAGGPVVNVRSTPLGTILTDAGGRSLYLFEADKPNKSNCSGACLSAWPPLLAGRTANGATGTQAAKLGTIAAPGGKRQVTYNGHPLYRYAGDQKAGDTAGQGLDQFGAEWYVVSPSGSKIDKG